MGILSEAQSIVDGDRQDHYGDPVENFEAIAEFWSTYLRRRKLTVAPLAPKDVAMMMVLLKAAREANVPKHDNILDMAGYADLYHRCVESEWHH